MKKEHAVIFELSFQTTLRATALQLDVGESWLKRECRLIGITRWPFRTVKTLQEMLGDTNGTVTAMNKEHIKLLLIYMKQSPRTASSVETLPPWVHHLRLQMFRRAYKKKKASEETWDGDASTWYLSAFRI